MPAPNLLVLVVDGLRASALGAYGNTTYPTPALDRLAADSQLFDWCFAPSCELADIYAALWQATSNPFTLALKSACYNTHLVTDDLELPTFAGSSDFADSVLIDQFNPPASGKLKHAADLADTALARTFAAAMDVIGSCDPTSPHLVWFHARGMYGAWDAPLQLQESLKEEGDPPPIEFTVPPDLFLDSDDDPDIAFRYSCAYAAQIMVLDECSELLRNFLESLPRSREWIALLVGARGFPLGEHRRIGGVDSRLYVEQLHVPCLVFEPSGRDRLARSNTLVTHRDISSWLATLIEAGQPTSSKSSAHDVADGVVATSRDGHRAIRTPEWCLRSGPSLSKLDVASSAYKENQSTESIELFVRPDDRWEANDVAKLCPEIVESLTARLNSMLSTEANR